MNDHPFITGQAQRRLARQQLRVGLRQAIQRTAVGGWDLKERLRGTTRPKNLPETITAAIQVTQSLLSEFDFPIQPKVLYTGIQATKRTADERNAPIENGTI